MLPRKLPHVSSCMVRRSLIVIEPLTRAFSAAAVARSKDSATDSSSGAKKKKITGPDPSVVDHAPASTEVPASSEFNVTNPQNTLVSWDAVKLQQTKTGTVDVRTHTGQFWEENDYRHVRFTPDFAQKLVNRRFAIDMVNSVPPTPRTERVIYCDGGGNPALGHPKVYINLDKPGPQSCGYCGMRFIKEGGHLHH